MSHHSTKTRIGLIAAVCWLATLGAALAQSPPPGGLSMFTFERIHQMARDARAKGQNKVELPCEEFSDAMQTFYAVTKGKRARDLMDEQRFSFSAWGVEFRRALERGA